MILPVTDSAVILCLVLSMVCLGSWINLLKLSGKWRYELFYLDFSFAAALVAVLAAFTLGSWDMKELTFQDNLLIASYHKMAYVLAAGTIFNLANLLLTGALSITPLSIVYPLSGGAALAAGLFWILFPPQGNLAFLLAGGLAALAAVVLGSFAYSGFAAARAAAAKTVAPKPVTPTARPSKSRVPTQAGPIRGIILSILSGVIFAMVPPLLNFTRTGEDGLGAYSAGLIFGIAILLSTIVFFPFFFGFPVSGEPVHLKVYAKGSRLQHLLGLFAGGLFMTGIIAGLCTGGTLATVQASSLETGAFGEGSILLGSLWGLLFWREFRGSGGRTFLWIGVMLILWIAGAALIVTAPLFAK